MWDECNCVVIWAFFGIAFLWDLNETDLFQSCGHCWVVQMCWHIEWSTSTALYFRIWNSSAEIPSPPLAIHTRTHTHTHAHTHTHTHTHWWLTLDEYSKFGSPFSWGTEIRRTVNKLVCWYLKLIHKLLSSSSDQYMISSSFRIALLYGQIYIT